eukprot:7171094-Prymnesium_polylepis.2
MPPLADGGGLVAAGHATGGGARSPAAPGCGPGAWRLCWQLRACVADVVLLTMRRGPPERARNGPDAVETPLWTTESYGEGTLSPLRSALLCDTL